MNVYGVKIESKVYCLPINRNDGRTIARFTNVSATLTVFGSNGIYTVKNGNDFFEQFTELEQVVEDARKGDKILFDFADTELKLRRIEDGRDLTKGEIDRETYWSIKGMIFGMMADKLEEYMS